MTIKRQRQEKTKDKVIDDRAMPLKRQNTTRDEKEPKEKVNTKKQKKSH